MKIFIFDDLEKVSGNYHEEGGLAVVARDKEHAEELIAADDFAEVTAEEWEEAVVYDLKGDEEPRIFVFPNAGCC